MSPDKSARPRATYRVQLHKGFTFEDAAALAPYLRDLGISHLYCSPYLQARAGSMHGYDVVDHSALNEELGGAEGHRHMVEALDACEMSHIVDIVPNHMTITDRRNVWWWDVLKHGPQSRYADHFDIDWDAPESRLKRQILLPILGDHYGRVLKSGELRLDELDGEVVVRYHEHVMPLAPGSTPDDIPIENAARDPELLHSILEKQYYRLAFWRAAGADLNYRRFFSINDLAALRIENERVFEATHALVVRLAEDDAIAGLRVDHIDGLRYPTEYLRRLRDRVGDKGIWVEKILEDDEMLPSAWPVEGSTGYEFANHVQQLFVDPAAEEPLSDLYDSLTGTPPLDEMAYEAKLHAMNTELAADIERLTELFVTICEKQRDYRDFTRPKLRQTLRETIAAFTIYRTYCDGRTGEVSDEDAGQIRDAIDAARARRRDLDPDLFSFLEDLLLLRHAGAEETALAMRFQQTTGPVMAKAVEDTLFYRYNRFITLNEVGGNPATFGIDLEAWHEYNQRILAAYPHTLLATSTHDTKRSEDVRARLVCLSEIPDRWREIVTALVACNERHRTEDLPDRNTEYVIYQTLVGAWPIDVERMTNYIAKATKEAKIHTSWIDPNPAYDTAVASFVRALGQDDVAMGALEDLVRGIGPAGHQVSGAQTLLKLTCPGIPDFYQGTELWDLSLVDPDNRRSVDYDERRSSLDRGHPKLDLIKMGLEVRGERPDVFADGGYEPLFADGTHSNHVIAHVRGEEVIAVAARFNLSRPRGWEDTALQLPAGSWRNRLDERVVAGEAAIADLLGDRSVALLTRENA